MAFRDALVINLTCVRLESPFGIRSYRFLAKDINQSVAFLKGSFLRMLCVYCGLCGWKKSIYRRGRWGRKLYAEKAVVKANIFQKC